MPDKTSLAIPDYLQRYIEATVEEVLIEGESFEEHKQYLRRYCEEERDYTILNDNLSDLFQAAQKLDPDNAQTIDSFIQIGKDCFLSDTCIDNLLSILTNPVSGKREGTKLFRIWKGKRFGFVDSSGNVVVGARYSDAHDFSDGLAAVKKGDLWGFINLDGEMVIPPQFEKAGAFHESRAAVYSDKYWGYINQNGELAIPCQYHCAGDFSEGLAPVCKNEKWGYIDTKGERKIELQFKEAFSFRNGLARVGEGSPIKYGFINKRGSFVIHPDLKYARDYSEEKAFVQYSEDNSNYYCYLDNTGKPVLFCKWSFADDFHEGLSCVSTQGEFGFIDENGEFAIRPQFDDAACFSDGLAAIKLGNLWGYVNKKGDIVISPHYLEAGGFQDGFAIVKNRQGFCLIDKTGITKVADIYADNLTHKKDVLNKNYIVASITRKEKQAAKERKVIHHVSLCALVFLASLLEFRTFGHYSGWGWAFVPTVASIVFTAFRMISVDDLTYKEFQTKREFALSFIPVFLINIASFIFKGGWSLAVVIPVLIASIVTCLAIDENR